MSTSSLPKIYVNNEMSSFVKHISLIIINSRISNKQMYNKGTNIPKTEFTITQKENFDIDDLFQLDNDYTFLSSPRTSGLCKKESNEIRTFCIEIYLTGLSILVERWIFSYT